LFSFGEKIEGFILQIISSLILPYIYAIAARLLVNIHTQTAIVPLSRIYVALFDTGGNDVVEEFKKYIDEWVLLNGNGTWTFVPCTYSPESNSIAIEPFTLMRLDGVSYFFWSAIRYRYIMDAKTKMRVSDAVEEEMGTFMEGALNKPTRDLVSVLIGNGEVVPVMLTISDYGEMYSLLTMPIKEFVDRVYYMAETDFIDINAVTINLEDISMIAMEYVDMLQEKMKEKISKAIADGDDFIEMTGNPAENLYYNNDGIIEMSTTK
jgi:hypothetical protein